MLPSLFALFAILVPILVVELPTLVSEMGSIRGTYDVLSVAFPLTRSQIFDLIPLEVQQRPSSNETILPVPEHVFDIIDPDKSLDRQTHHVALLQMGYQLSTGPGPTWLPKFSFHECKLEIPFVRHPKGSAERPLVYKQSILFSNPVIQMGSSTTGLTSFTTSFSPAYTPQSFEQSAPKITYSANGYVDADAQLVAGADDNPHLLEASWAVYRELAQDWWFGKGTGNKVQKFAFDFDNADIKPTPYDVRVRLNLAAFSPSSKKDSSDLSGAKEVTVQGIGWRSRASMTSAASTIGNI